MAQRLEGKVAIVTGGASGLGKAMATLFAAEGTSVVVADIDDELGPQVAADIERQGGRAFFAFTDVTRSSDLEAVVDKAVSQFGKLDIMVNNAGIGGVGPLTDLTEEAWDIVMAVNLKGVFLGTKYAFPALIANGGGVILNTASVAGLTPAPNFAPYGVAKAGVIQLTKITALEGAPHNIRANALCPVWVETPMVQAFIEMSGNPEAARAYLRASVPLGRIGTPDDVAQAALYLASDAASFITGVAFPIDGGTSTGVNVAMVREAREGLA